MFNAILLGVALLGSPQAAPFNYTGKLTDLLPEGASWGMPKTGLPVQFVLTGKGETVSAPTFSLKGTKWAANADLNFKDVAYADGSLSGGFTFKNGSGFALDGVRFDVVSATERYKGKDAKGADVELTRALPVTEESPILLGDVVKDASVEGAPFKASGLAWKPETIDITVTAKLSGLTYQRVLFPDHANSFIDFDPKGRLILGSGEQSGIYRANLETGTLEQITSTPSYKVQIAVSPTDGTIAARWMNGHGFTFYTPGGDEKSSLDEAESDGRGGGPLMPRYDGKGNLYAGFGHTISQFNGDKPAFILKGAGQFEFGEYPQFDVARDGTLYVASDHNIFKFDPGGKNGKLLIKGPNEKLGRIWDINAIRVDPAGNVWVAEPSWDKFVARVSVFDSNGKLVWVFGRGGDRPMEDGYYDGQVLPTCTSMVISADGRVYIACGESVKSVIEFIEF